MEPNWRIRNYFQDLDDQILSALRLFHVELLRYNQKLGLIPPGTEKDIDVTLFFESISASRFIAKDSGSNSVLQIGAANGFPGLVYSLINKDSQVTLAEEDERFCEFLRHMIARLEIKNVKVISGKLDQLKLQPNTVAFAKDVSNLARTLLLGNKIFSKGSKLYILKGTDWFSELASLPSQICSTWNTEMALEYDLPERKGIRVVLRSLKIS